MTFGASMPCGAVAYCLVMSYNLSWATQLGSEKTGWNERFFVQKFKEYHKSRDESYNDLNGLSRPTTKAISYMKLGKSESLKWFDVGGFQEVVNEDSIIRELREKSEIEYQCHSYKVQGDGFEACCSIVYNPEKFGVDTINLGGINLKDGDARPLHAVYFKQSGLLFLNGHFPYKWNDDDVNSKYYMRDEIISRIKEFVTSCSTKVGGNVKHIMLVGDTNSPQRFTVDASVYTTHRGYRQVSLQLPAGVRPKASVLNRG